MVTLAGIVFAAIGLTLLLDLAGAARSLADLGQRQRRRWGTWMTAGTPRTAGAVRVFGVAFIVVGLGIAVFPPT
jgi:hypothetical protein